MLRDFQAFVMRGSLLIVESAMFLVARAASRLYKLARRSTNEEPHVLLMAIPVSDGTHSTLQI